MCPAVSRSSVPAGMMGMDVRAEDPTVVVCGSEDEVKERPGVDGNCRQSPLPLSDVGN